MSGSVRHAKNGHRSERGRALAARGAAALALALLVGACATPVFVETDAAPRDFAPRRLVLVPFEPATRFLSREPDRALVSREAAALVTAGVLDALSRIGEFYVIPPGEVGLALQGVDASAQDARLVEVFAPDAIVSGRVLRFDGRVGGSGDPVGPSYVAFTLEVTGAGGERLWRGLYEEAQQSLFEDLSSFARARERGFRWVGPETLARYGSREVVRLFARRVGADPGGLDREDPR